MGTDKKKQVNQLLVFVKHLYDHPDYNEFAAGIRSIVLNDEDFLSELRKEAAAGDPDAIRKIEAYLSLDFQIDAKELPDYGFIADDAVRERLQADYREMLRYEFGTRNHKIDFAEFCRYATLQIEMLTNFYFEKKYSGDIATIIQVFTRFSPNLKLYSGLSNVSEIALKTKIFQLRNEFQWDRKALNPYLYAVEVRNNQSHRSLVVNKDLIRETEQKLKAGGAWTTYGKPDYTKAASVIGQDAFNEYNYQVWVDQQPFQEVTEAIKNLVDAISSSI